MKMRVERPIVIIGAGRSGSSIFFDILSHHPNVSVITSVLRDHPNHYFANRMVGRIANVRRIGARIRRIYPAVEGYWLWDRLFPGFSHSYRDLRASDVSVKTQQRVMSCFERLLVPSRPQLILKLTGWPRIGFIRQIFPDAIFIHIQRDGRSVANSTLNVDWWSGWRGPSAWLWGPLKHKYQTCWEKHDRSFVALSAIEWLMMLDALENSKSDLSDQNFIEIRYEDLCAKPIDTFEKVLKFCRLEWNSDFHRKINNTKFSNTNYKWQEELTPAQQRILEDLLSDRLKKLGYQ